jgi:hypothetical protein
MSYGNMNNSGYNNSSYGNNMNNSSYGNNMNNPNMNTSGMQGQRTGAAGKGPDMICKSKSQQASLPPPTPISRQ